MNNSTALQKLTKKRKKLGMIAISGIWSHPDDKETIRQLVDHLNYVRFGVAMKKRDDGKDKLSIRNSTSVDITIDGIQDKTNETVISGKKLVKSGKTVIFNE